MGMLLVIDFFALMCGESDWVLEFYKTYKNTLGLGLLPNWIYSNALALFMKGVDAKISLNSLQVI